MYSWERRPALVKRVSPVDNAMTALEFAMKEDS
jgi:hypothetical protein